MLSSCESAFPKTAFSHFLLSLPLPASLYCPFCPNTSILHPYKIIYFLLSPYNIISTYISGVHGSPRPLSMRICNTHDEMIPTYVRCNIGKIERLAWVTCHYEMGYRRVKCNLGLDWVLWLLSVPHGITLMVHAHQIQRRMSGWCIPFIFCGEQEIRSCFTWWIRHINLTDSVAVCEFAWWWLTLCKLGLSSTMQPDHKTQIRPSN